MYNITVYEATNPSGVVFTARMEGRSCKGEGRTISDALRDLADDLEGAKSEAATKARREVLNVTPYAYACPENCGCLWRDNWDGTMSLFGANSLSCKRCEVLPLTALIPLYSAQNELLRKELTVVAPTGGKVDKKSTSNDYQVGGSHYRSEIQHWDYVIANDIPYLEAQVIKYLTRWRKKNGMEDVLKSKHYLDKLIEVETSKNKET